MNEKDVDCYWQTEADEQDEQVFEVYTFNERTGSENIHTFSTQEAADRFLARQPAHKMAH